MEGDGVWSGLSLLSFLSKSYLFSKKGEVRLMGHKTQHDLKINVYECEVSKCITVSQGGCVCVCVCVFVGSFLATKVFIGNLLATRRGWVIVK